MNKFIRVMKYEYSRHVLRRRFILSLLSVPALIGVMLLVGIIAAYMENDRRPIGYIDHSGFLSEPLQLPKEDGIFGEAEIIPFENEEQAQEALDAEQIQAFYVLSQDYLVTGKVQLHILADSSSQGHARFYDFIRLNILREYSPQVRERLLEGADLVAREPDGGRETGESDWLNALTPYIAGLAFMIAMFTSSGYIMQSVVEEKENRTMEVMVTSVTPMQLMSGKVVGLIGVGLTQLVFWIGVAVAAVVIGRNYFPFLDAVRMSWGSVAIIVVTVLPAFVLLSGLMAAVGATATDLRETQQLTSLFILPVVAPYWFAVPIMSNPNGPIAMALSFFPLTAPVTVTMRLGASTVPTWQIVLVVVIETISALIALWIAARTFRLGMLQYGKRLSLRQIFVRRAAM